MLAIYSMFLSFNIVATIISAWLCYKIAYLKLTPTTTWILLFFAFILMLVRQANGVIYISDIIKFADQYSIWTIIVSQVINAGISLLFLVSILGIYNALKQNGIAK